MEQRLKNELLELTPYLAIKNNLTSLEQDILALLISKIDDNKNTTIYEFSINEFRRLTNSTDKNIYSNVVKAVKKTWARGGFDLKTSERDLSLQIISSAEHIKKKGIIEIEISKKIKPYLYTLKNSFYGSRKNLEEILSIKSKYSKKIYELCYLLHVRNGMSSIDLTFNEFKQILGIPVSSYTFFNDFEKRILKEAVSDISGENAKTNMFFSYKKNNMNRRGVPVSIITLSFSLFEYNKVYINNKPYIKNRIKELISWGNLTFTAEEQIYIYAQIVRKNGYEFDSNAIIKRINATVHSFALLNLVPDIEAFIDKS